MTDAGIRRTTVLIGFIVASDLLVLLLSVVDDRELPDHIAGTGGCVLLGDISTGNASERGHRH